MRKSKKRHMGTIYIYGISRARLFLVGRVCVFDQDNKEVDPESSFLTMQRPIPHTERSF